MRKIDVRAALLPTVTANYRSREFRGAPETLASLPAARGRLVLAAAVSLLLSASLMRAGVNRWTSTGPDGGHVTAIAVDPSNPEIVYAGTAGGGLFRSTDAAESWIAASAGLAIDFVQVILVDPADTQTLYVGTRSGVFKSTDGASSWTAAGPYTAVGALAMDPVAPAVLYAGTSEGIVKSSDRGTTWRRLAESNALKYVNSLAIDPANSSTVYATSSEGFFRSRDAGLSWDRATGLISRHDNRFRYVAFDSTTPSTLYASTDGSICRSRNESTWSCSSVGIQWIESLLFRSEQGRHAIYAAGPPGIYRSIDGGSTWTESDAGLRSLGYVHVVAGSRERPLYAGTDVGVFRSQDTGGRWINTSAGLRAVGIRSVAADPQNPQTVYAAGEAGLFKSPDAGASWMALDPENPQVTDRAALAIDPATPSTLYAAGNPNVLKTLNGGETWSSVSVSASAIGIDPAAPSTVYAAGSGVQKSTDGGNSWRATTMSRSIYSLLIDPSHPSTLYAGSDFLPDEDYPRNLGGGVYKTSDGGQNWTRSQTNLGYSVKALAINPSDSSTLYAGAAGVWRSTDGGSSWARVSQGLPESTSISAIVVDPLTPSRIYLASNGDGPGIYQSEDSGLTWLPFNDGLTNRRVSALAIDREGRILYAGTEGGGVFEMEVVSSPCAPGNERLCLLGHRFLVELTAIDPRTGRSAVGEAISQGDRFGYFSLPAFTGDPTFPEIFVKMADATSLPAPVGGFFWVFYSGLTDLHYTVRIIDTVTGRERTYQSDGYCGGADTAAFPGDGLSAPNGTDSMLGATPLSDSGEELSLLGNRFQVTLSAFDPHTNRRGVGAAIPQGDRFGYFSLPSFTGDPAFPEVFVKMADGDSPTGGSFWFFHTGLTDLRYTLTVTDTTTGIVKTYQNDPSDPSRLCGGADTAAFSGDGLAGTWNGTIVAGPLPGVGPDEICDPESISAVVRHDGIHVSITFSPVCMGQLEFQGTLAGHSLSGEITDVTVGADNGPFAAPASGHMTSSSINLQSLGYLHGQSGWFTSAVVLDLHR